jgi:hypothetical protein
MNWLRLVLRRVACKKIRGKRKRKINQESNLIILHIESKEKTRKILRYNNNKKNHHHHMDRWCKTNKIIVVYKSSFK